MIYTGSAHEVLSHIVCEHTSSLSDLDDLTDDQSGELWMALEGDEMTG